MSDLLAQNMYSLGIAKLARAIAELAVSEISSTPESIILSLAFLDSIYSSELIVRASILKIELEENLANLGEGAVSEIRQAELINGSSRLSFLKLPEELERISGKSIINSKVYYEMNHLRKILLSEEIDPTQLVEPTLRFAFESIEPLIIDIWGEIIALYFPELDFEVDKYIDILLTRYNVTVSQHDLFEDD